jgi:hypothetical protein
VHGFPMKMVYNRSLQMVSRGARDGVQEARDDVHEEDGP